MEIECLGECQIIDQTKMVKNFYIKELVVTGDYISSNWKTLKTDRLHIDYNRGTSQFNK